MKKEIFEFYAHPSRSLHIEKLINRRPVGLSPYQVLTAAEIVYNEILYGLEIKTINIARRVWNTAKEVTDIPITEIDDTEHEEETIKNIEQEPCFPKIIALLFFVYLAAKYAGFV